MITIALLCSTLVFGQEVRQERAPKIREIGVNMTSLLTQILPFQSASELNGPFQVQFKSGRNNRLFSFKLGARVNDFDDDGNFLNLAIGYNRRRTLSPKWDMNVGYHFMIIGGSFNDPVNSATETGGVGFGWDLGFQYNFNPRFSLGTATTLFVGPTSNIFTVTFVPPIGIFLIGRLN